MNIENLNQLTRHQDLIIRKLEKDYYLIMGQTVFETNEIGATIVNSAERNLPLSELCIKISEKYDNKNLGQIRKDIDDFINFTLSNGVLFCAK